MENLQQDFQKVNITNIKTGLVYDLQTSLHKSEKQHVECPERITSILDHLQQQNLKQKCVVFEKLESPAKESEILLAHPKDYLNYIENLWPQETDKSQIYIKDTYFNKNTFECAKISAGLILLAVDQIMNGQIQNSFVLTRPPGHHAGTQNCCSGFCFFNNVAIAANYLKSKYNLKKILIFDWDIHYGNGTQQIFDEDPNVLYFSMHRYDKGTFFPQTGIAENVGNGLGKGFTINLPWNTDQQHNLMVGDKEYIYTFERIAMPIFEQFNPDFVIVSCGFDAAKGDPIGKCDVTYDGYAYMIHRLMSLTKGRILAALEGGYSLESLKWASESVIRVLLGENLPITNSLNKYTLEQMKLNCIPNQVGLDTVNQCLPILTPYWTALNNQELLKYQEFILKKFDIQNNISAGHRDQYMFQGDKFLKKAKIQEINFYKDIDNKDSKYYKQNQILKQFMPKFYGMIEKDGENFIILENLLQNRENASIMDIKFGFNTYGPKADEAKRQRSIQRSSKTTSVTLGFRISGLILKDLKGQSNQKWTKEEGYYSIKENDIMPLIKQVLMSNESKEINKEAHKDLLDFIIRIKEFIENENSRYFIASSLLIIIDNINKNWVIKWIDFNYVGDLPENEKIDNNILPGLNNLLNIVSAIN